jgi:hypothetical protein
VAAIRSGTSQTPLVVISSAVPASNPELLEARRLGLPVCHRSDVLAALINSQASIAVAGSHGKTTTSTLVATLLAATGQDPTAVIGGVVPAFGSNGHHGTGELLVAEADESDGSLVKFRPRLGLITNLELDHTDHYSDLDALISTLQRFANGSSRLLANRDCPILREHFEASHWWSVESPEGVDFAAIASEERGDGSTGGRGDFRRQRTAVGVAEDDAVGAAGDGGQHGGDRVGRIVLPTVDRVLAVVDDLAAMGLQEGDRVADHLEVLLGRAAEDFADVQGGGLAVDRHDRGVDLEEAADLGVFGRTHALAAGRAEGRQLGVLELDLLGAGEELDVAGVGARPAAFDVGHAEALELGGDAQLVIDGEMNALPLRAVAEGGVIDFDGACHGGVGGKEV